MRSSVVVVIAALLLTGCSYFIPASKLKECEDNILIVEKTLEYNNTLMLEAISVIDSIQYENELIKWELKKCQEQSKKE